MTDPVLFVPYSFFGPAGPYTLCTIDCNESSAYASWTMDNPEENRDQAVLAKLSALKQYFLSQILDDTPNPQRWGRQFALITGEKECAENRQASLTHNTQSVFLGLFLKAAHDVLGRKFRACWDYVTVTGDITPHDGVVGLKDVGGIPEKYAAAHTHAAVHQGQTHLFLYIGDEMQPTPELLDNLTVWRFSSEEPIGEVVAFLFERRFNSEQETLFGRAAECMCRVGTYVATAAFIQMTHEARSPAWQGCLIHGEGETGKSALALELALWLAEREYVFAPVWVTINNAALMAELSKRKVHNPIADMLAGQVEDSTDPIVDYIAGHIEKYLQSGWRPEQGLRAMAEELQKKKYLLVLDNVEIDCADEIMEAVKTITGGVTGRKLLVIITSRFNEKEAGHAQRIGLANKPLSAWEMLEVRRLVENVMHNQPYEARIDKDSEAFQFFITRLYQHFGTFPGLIIQTVPLLERISITELNALLLGLHEKSFQEKAAHLYAAIFSEFCPFLKVVLFALIASIDWETPLDDIKTGKKEIREKIEKQVQLDSDDTPAKSWKIEEDTQDALIDLERSHLIYHTEQNGKTLYGIKSLAYITFMFEEQFDEPLDDGYSMRDSLFDPVDVVMMGLRTSQPANRLQKYLEKVYAEPKPYVFLCLAAGWSNRPEHIDLLLDFDNDIDRVGAKLGTGNGTPLQCAAVFNENTDILQRLLDRGANYKIKDAEGNNLLHYAAGNPNPAIIPILVNAGLDMYAKNKFGFMPIQLAAFQPNPAVIKMFFDMGADPAMSVSSDGKTLLHCAALNKNPAVAQVLIDEKKLDVMAVEKNGWTPLHRAVSLDKNGETIKLLLERGADINFATDMVEPNGIFMPGPLPIHVAAAANKTSDNIDVLIEMGARVDTKDSYGQTPLHRTARNNSEPDMITILLERDAAINEKDSRGATALYEASFNKNPKIATALIKAGASLDDELHDILKESALKLLQKRKDWPLIKAAIKTRS